MHPALLGLVTIVVGVGACVGYFYGANLFLDKVLFPAKGPNAGRNINRANMIRPWVFLFPALFALGLYLAYPVFETIRLSLTERLPGGRSQFVGFDNYAFMFAEGKFWEAVRNNVLWLVVVPAASTGFGLLAAQLTDRLAWGNIAKSIIFMPMAISLVGASVIFKLVYEARPEDVAQIGILNHINVEYFGGRSAATVAANPILEQLLFDDRPDLDPDRFCHGHPVRRPARYPRGNRRGRDRRRRGSVPDVSSRSRCRRSCPPSSWSGRRSPSRR